MALVLADRVQETSTTAGTGALTLAGAVGGFQSFAVVGNGNTCYYTVVDGSDWEVGIGTYSTTGPTLARTTVLSNSSGTTSPLSLSSAAKPVFLTYPSEKSVNLDASGNVSPLGTIASGTWQGSTVGVAYGGTGVTSSSGANSVVLRDANQNVSINRLNQSTQTITASGGTTVLTAASAFNQALVGTGNQTFQLPDATTLTDTTTFQFNNNATGTLTITDYANATVGTVASGGAAGIALLANATVGGTWDVHAYIPENVTWGTNALALGSTVITGGTWNGGTIAPAYGGTGLTSYTSGGAVYATGTSTLTSGTLPIASGGTGATTASGARTSLDVPSTTGSGASGTWGINISGNAASATSAPNYLPLAGGTMTGTLTGVSGTTLSFDGGSTTSASYNYVLAASNDTGTKLVVFVNGSTRSGDGGVDATTIRNDGGAINFGSASYATNLLGSSINANGNVVLSAGNYNSYAPTLTGTGASGTWGINISGNAATSTSTTTAQYVINNVDGSVIVESNTSEANNWLWKEAVKQWGTFYFNKGSESGQTIGTYTTIGAETFYMGGSSGIAMPTGWTGYQSGSYIAAMISHYTGYIYSASSMYAAGSMYSPIYYDSNDTGYYINPNGTSNIYALTVNNAATFYGDGSSRAMYIRGSGNIIQFCDADGTFRWENVGRNGTYYVYKGYGTGAGYKFQIDDSGNITLNNGSSTTVSGSLYAPILYDSNNTGYYLDPSSDSNIANLYVANYFDLTTVRAASVRGYAGNFLSTQSASSNYPPFNFASTYADHSWGVVASFRINATGGGDRPSIQFSTGSSDTRWNVGYCFYDDQFRITQNMGINNSGGNDGWGTERFRIDTGGNVVNSVATYSPIFYDSNDTGYYCDPANISNFNTRLQIQAYNAYSPNYAYGLQLGSNAGVTAWNFNPGGSSEYRNLTFYGTGWNGSAVVTRSILTIGNYGGYVGIRNDSPNYELDITGTGYASNDFRAPIFYDSNNTGYYLDPASYSFLYFASVNVGQEAPNAANSSSDGLVLRGNYNSNTWAHKFHKYDNGSGVPLYLSTTYGAGSWTAVQGWGGGLPYTSQIFGSLGLSAGLYAPIFYDSDNTGYYVDPAGTSIFNIVAFGGSSAYSFGSNYWAGTGGYPGYQYIGGNTRFGFSSTGGAVDVYTDGNFYGGIDYSGANRLVPLFDYNQGGGALYSSILYDTNNTNYYCDPNGTSVVNKIALDLVAVTSGVNGLTSAPLYTQYANAGGTNTWYPMTYQRAQYSGGYVTHLNTGLYKLASGWGENSTGWYAALGGSDSYPTMEWRLTYGTYIYNSNNYVSTYGSFRAPLFYDSDNTNYFCDPSYYSQFNGVYADNWFRPQGDTGLYFQTYGYGLYAPQSGGNSYGNVTTYAVGRNGWTGYGLGPRITLMTDTNNGGVTTGLHDSNVGWYWRYVYDSYFVVDRGYSTFANSARAPIFYDSEDTTYYLNPNGYSQINGNGSTAGSSSVGLNVYSTGGNGAIMAFHRGGYYAVNMGLDSDNVIRIGGWSASANRLQMDMSGNLTMAGNVTAYSDERLKKDWLSLASDFIVGLAGIKAGTYTRIDSGERQVGVSAQDIQKLVAEAVTEDAAGMLSVNYGGAALAAAVELAKEAVDLRARVATLEALISKLIKD